MIMLAVHDRHGLLPDSRDQNRRIKSLICVCRQILRLLIGPEFSQKPLVQYLSWVETSISKLGAPL